MIKQNQRYLNALGIILDALAILVSLIFAWFLRFKSGLIYSQDATTVNFYYYLIPTLCIIPVYLILYASLKLYTPQRYKNFYEESINILKANVVGITIFILMLYITKKVNYSRYLLFILGISNVVITVLERAIIRLILRNLRRKGYNLKHIVVIGYNSLTFEFLKRIKRNKQWGYNIIAILDNNIKDLKALEEVAAVSIKEKFNFSGVSFDGMDTLEKYLNDFEVDEVFITLNIKQYDALGKIIDTCEKSGVRTQIIPDYYKYIPAKPYVEELEGLPVINIRYVPLDNMINKFIKRIIDIIGAAIALIIFSPIMILTACLIKITSPGPIIFKQERVGLNKRSFIMYKFRSMRVQKDEEEVAKWTTSHDPRKTKLGTFIRKTSIDELPQFFNVLKGDMSLVGPRPERPYFVEQFKEEIPKYMIKHQVRPGITGWAQVNGWRGDTSIEKRIECDIYYIENWNFWLDIKIMFLTVFKGFVNKNAY
ncbi:undecaprenyl-phosphate glucose phosphotransferase [Clostridium malenominatum]|uniref:Undecaprenyl-phosphate glucose phosphotransferase n=1 Tax=Clostridium malenominatum TaxID=1539 RepID=A0ABP3UDD3_9CLOT